MTDSIAPPPPPTLQPPPPVPATEPGVAPPPSVPPRGLTNRSIFIIWFVISGIVALPLAWYSTRITRGAKLMWSGLTAVQLVALTVWIVATVGASGSGLANQVAATIQQQLPGQAQQALATTGISDATVTNVKVTCTSPAANQYTCSATYDVTSASASLDHQAFQQAITAQTDSAGTLSWHAAGSATPAG